MNNVRIINVIDRDSEQNAQVIVRSVEGFVALTLTLEHEGDVQVVMNSIECKEVILRLQQAVSDIDTPQNTAVTTRPEVVELELAGKS